jgi:hypothetical protein
VRVSIATVRMFCVLMLSVTNELIVLTVVMLCLLSKELKPIMLSVIMTSTIMLSVVYAE